MRFAVLCLLLALPACGAPNGPPLVSTQFPPGTGVVNAQSIAQSANSLPPGAANVSRAPGGMQPSYGSFGFRP
ncbi:MAG: hypothetical protein JOZ05_09720 [Acetobacteraceae bacterium]|nr:hypothetical protein [Acetobacteraceae bacterium]